MYRVLDRRKAVELRLKGWSYSQIRKEINVGKGTLSYWLNNYPLTVEQKLKIYSKRDLWVERFRESMAMKRKVRMERNYEDAKNKFGVVGNRDLEVAGAFLYWGEGQKMGDVVSVSNANPEIIKFAIKWLESCFSVNKSSMKVCLHLYSDMNVEEEIGFWVKQLEIDRSRFAKPYIKKSTKANLDYKSFGHGTCRIQVGSVKIKEQIMATIGLISGLGPSFNGRTRFL